MAYKRVNKEFRLRIAARVDQLRLANQLRQSVRAESEAWTWCIACRSYHSPTNPTCFKRTRRLRSIGRYIKHYMHVALGRDAGQCTAEVAAMLAILITVMAGAVWYLAAPIGHTFIEACEQVLKSVQ